MDVEGGEEGGEGGTEDDYAFGGHADLTGVEETAEDEGSGGVFDVGVL